MSYGSLRKICGCVQKISRIFFNSMVEDSLRPE